MLLPFMNLQPLSVGLRAGGKWLNWTKSTPTLPVWETPFVAADHLQACAPDHDIPTLQEATIDNHTLCSADSVAKFAGGNLLEVIPIPPGMIAPDGPHSVLADSGFEQVQVGAGQFQYRPTGSPWTFTGGSGISATNSPFTAGSPIPPDGSQVAFIQMAGSFSQTISGWTIGTYILTFGATQRVNIQKAQQDFIVLVDGVIVGTFTPGSGSYQRCATFPFAITAGAHVITFRGLDTANSDNTVFVDSIRQFMVI